MKRLVLPVVSLAWAIFVMFFFVQYNHPDWTMLYVGWIKLFFFNYSGLDQVFSRAGYMLLVGAQLFLSCTCAYWVGRQVLAGFLGIKAQSLRSRLLLYLPIGLGVLVYACLGAGLCGLYYKFFFYSIPLLGLLAFASAAPLKTSKLVWAEFKSGVRNGWRSSAWAFAAVAAVLLLSLLLVYVPDTEYDALTYHLAAPQHYLQHHKLINIPLHFTTFHPFFTEMLYTYGLGCFGQELAKGFNFVFYFLMFLVFLEMEVIVSRRAALQAAALFLTIPLVAVVTDRAYIDIVLTFWQTLLLWLLLRKVLLDRSFFTAGEIVLLSLCGGFALAAKYTAVVSCVMAACGIVVLGLWQGVPLKKYLPKFLIFCALGLAVFSPWLLKNFVYSGNPVFPFLYSRLGGMPWTELSDKLVQHEYTQYNEGYNSVLDYVLEPWKVIVRRHGSSDDASLAVWFLIFLPLSIFMLRGRNKIFFLSLGLAGVLFAVWFATCQHVRFLLPAFSWFSLACAGTLEALTEKERQCWQGRSKGRLWQGLAAVLVWYSVVLCWEQVGTQSGGPGGVWAGVESKEKFLRRALRADYFDAMFYTSRFLPQGKQVLILGDDRSFYLDKAHVSSSFYYPQLKVLLQQSQSSEDIYKKLKQLHADYLLYSKPFTYQSQKQYGTYELTPREIRLWADFWRSRVKVSFVLYHSWCLAEVLEQARSPLSGLAFLPGAEEKLCIAGIQLEEAGKTDEAQKVYEQALAVVPDLVMPHERLAQLYLSRKQMQKADREVELAVVYGSTRLELHVLRAYFLLHAKKFEQAVQESESAIRLDPKMADSYYYLGAAYEGLRRWDEAEEALQKGLGLDAGNQQFKDKLAEIMRLRAKRN